MRKEARTATTTADIARVQGYHESDYSATTYNRESYAFQGYDELKYFTSDRFQKCTIVDGVSVRPDGKPLKGYGLEIETECYGISNSTVYAEVLDKIVLAKFPAGLFKLQHDGSLGGETSAEIITQVQTKEFIRNHYSNYKQMYDTYFSNFGISADRSGNCGMHVNISTGNFGVKPEIIEDNCKKLLYIVNHHYDFCAALFYRNTSATTYCGRMRDYSTKEGAKNADIHMMPSSHYNCMNYSHFDAGRVEVRLVGGQKNFACFRNTMESVFFLVDAVKRLRWEDLDDLTKIFKGCNKYVFDRIRSYCYQRGTISADEVNAIRATMDTETEYI